MSILTLTPEARASVIRDVTDDAIPRSSFYVPCESAVRNDCRARRSRSVNWGADSAHRPFSTYERGERPRLSRRRRAGGLT